MSISALRRSRSGSTSAALPSTPIDSGVRWSRASYASLSASTTLSGSIEIAVFDAPPRCGRIAFDDERDTAVHRHRQWLRATHPPSPAVKAMVPARVPRALRRYGGERLVRALQDLRADVDPRAGGHLPVHRQAQRLQSPELLPCRPVADQVELAMSTRGAHSCVRKTPHRAPALNEQGLLQRRRVRTMVSYDGQSRAALPVPPTTGPAGARRPRGRWPASAVLLLAANPSRELPRAARMFGTLSFRRASDEVTGDGFSRGDDGPVAKGFDCSIDPVKGDDLGLVRRHRGSAAATTAPVAGAGGSGARKSRAGRP